MSAMKDEIRQITGSAVRAMLPARPADGHKGTFGHLLSVCGAVGMAGAACFAAEAAYRCGTGLLTAAIPREIYPIVTARVPEAVCVLLESEETGGISREAWDVLRPHLELADAVLFGCGIGKGDGAAALLSDVLKFAPCPVVLDADGLNLLSAHTDSVETTAPLCLTPHPAEAARLLHTTTEAVQANRVGAVRALAERYDAVAVLKGHETLIAEKGKPTLCNRAGNDALATGGSGDVLAGILGGFAAQGMSLYEAAACGVYLHGLAGERAAAELSRRGTLARDLLPALARLLSEYE